MQYCIQRSSLLVTLWCIYIIWRYYGGNNCQPVFRCPILLFCWIFVVVFGTCNISYYLSSVLLGRCFKKFCRTVRDTSTCILIVASFYSIAGLILFGVAMMKLLHSYFDDVTNSTFTTEIRSEMWSLSMSLGALITIIMTYMTECYYCTKKMCTR